MGWWKRLKVWQKAGIFVGGIHFIIYIVVLSLFPPIWVYLLLFMEWPWEWVLRPIGYSPVTFAGIVFLGFIGTLLYALSTMLISWLLLQISRKWKGSPS